MNANFSKPETATELRTCNTCQRELFVGDFGRLNKKTPTGTCRACISTQKKKWRAAHPGDSLRIYYEHIKPTRALRRAWLKEQLAKQALQARQAR